MWILPRRHSYSTTSGVAVAAVLLMVVAAAVMRDSVVLVAAALATSLYVTARVWSGQTARHIEVARTCPERTAVGEEIEVKLRVRNRSRLPIPWMRLLETVPVPLGGGGIRSVIAIGGRQESAFTYTLRPAQRGLYRVGTLEADVGDLIGVQSNTVVIPEERQQILVYPRIVPLHQLGLCVQYGHPAVPVLFSLFEDTDRMVGIREYRPGDSLRHMHWPATAQTGQPHVRQFQPALGRPALLCLDLDLYSGTTEEAVVVAASLADHIIRREGQPIGLVTQGFDPAQPEELHTERSQNGIDLAPAHTRAHLAHLLECLARVQPRAQDALPELLRAAAARLPRSSSVVLITGRPRAALIEALAHARRRGQRAAIIAIGRESSAAVLGSSSAIPVYHLRDGLDLGAL